VTAPLTQTTGRRKEAIARVRVRPGTGVVTVNGKPIEVHFPTPTQRNLAIDALRITNTAESYDVDATIIGGGVSGQAFSPATRGRRSPRSTASRRPARPRSTRSAERSGLCGSNSMTTHGHSDGVAVARPGPAA
jgi:hypothetical protein